MILPIYAALDHMDPALIEAGKDLYGTPLRTFLHVTWQILDPSRDYQRSAAPTPVRHQVRQRSANT